MTETVRNQETPSLELIGPWLWRRFRAPCKSVTFHTYLWGSVVACGGAGIWLTMFRANRGIDTVAAALLTYFPALVAASLIDLVQEDQPYLRSFAILVGIVFLILFLFGAFSTHGMQLWWATIGSFLGILFWWIANGEKAWVRDVRAENATGGSVSKELLKSDDKGWKV